MKYLFSVIVLLAISFSSFSQTQTDDGGRLSETLKKSTKKGDYAILEMRLNKEDEFRTKEGGSSSLARLAIFTGNNDGEVMLLKGFEGMNSVVTVLNNLKRNGWKLIDVYTFKGESLILTHYIIERRR